MLTFQNSVEFMKGEAPPVILRNFYEPENGFVWSTSTWSEIIFPFSESTTLEGFAADLILDLDVFKAPPTLPNQAVKFYLNGLRIGSRDVLGRMTAIVAFDAAILKPTDNVLSFDTPQSSVPDDFGVSDSRRLGLQLFSMQLRLVG